MTAEMERGGAVELPVDVDGRPWRLGDAYELEPGGEARHVEDMTLYCEGWLIDGVEAAALMRPEARPVTLTVYPFDMGTEQDKARKVVEEAAEAFSAWESLRLWDSVDVEDVLYECMDCMQACVNLMASLGAAQEDVDAAYTRVHAANEERGRYE